MIPEFSDSGLLPPGIYWVSWSEMFERFSHSPRRRMLLDGLFAALQSLKIAGCQTLYVDGSFVTAKEDPNDYDACWEEAGVDPDVLDPVLLTFDAGRKAQKDKYLGELFPVSAVADSQGSSFLEFFQTDRETGQRKGIIAIDLGGMS